MTARHYAHADISRRRSRIIIRALSHVVAGIEDTNSARKHYNLPPTCGASKLYTRSLGIHGACTGRRGCCGQGL
ncbi:hypothetical protein HanXRQr2_Chr16g0750231 [Helianthus annuus]|uniref:Uncharacterized protein n=1 Tax=Helianthus annuus TaxID=4232 RepID=A0A251RZQ1_HELAN|nr:hypothetical protein HanXRQr2_Chr16g0750231 [Helianthus annuus]